MKRTHWRAVLGHPIIAAWLTCWLIACSKHTQTTGSTGTGGVGGQNQGSSVSGAGGSFASTGSSFGTSMQGCPSTCSDLGANCGTVTDTKCGGVVMCGGCPTGELCGGAGTANVCGKSGPCTPLTCSAQNVACGPAGDGCGGMLQCGTCTMPQTCGGNPAKPGQCGCTGLCAQVPNCPSMTTTTITGAVWDPAGIHPLYNALVYIPNDPTDPGLQPFPAGISCDICGATAAGNPLVSAYTAPDGTFQLKNVPVGASIPLVIQLGRWRRQFTVNVANSCAANAVPGKLTMPKTHMEGDIPRIGILTGGLDPVECTLRKMGVADSEFTNAGGGGHINFFKALDNGASNPAVQGHGAVIDASTPDQAALMAMNGGKPVIDQYDAVVLECEGYPQTESASDLAGLLAYAGAGGRIFGSDFAWSWLRNNGSFQQAANWSGPLNGGTTAAPVNIDLVNNPKGMPFDQWLEIIGVSAPGSQTIPSMFPAFENTSGVVPPTQRWLYGNNLPALHFTFNTPVGAPSMNQCGRVVYSDWHAQQPSAPNWPKTSTFPAECTAGAMTAQQAVLEFMLFDLSACVQPYTPLCTPKTCAQENIGCGPASDGCGGLLNCGSCPMGQTCGGAAPGQCGVGSCTPETCAFQGIQCGPAGDGCGNQIACGNCPTGEICGVGGPGKCGKLQ